jgi:hypothetical protein
MQRIQHSVQIGEEPAALYALTDVALDPHAPLRSELSVQEVRHVARRPPMIQPEARSVQDIAHLNSDPINAKQVRTARGRT